MFLIFQQETNSTSKTRISLKNIVQLHDLEHCSSRFGLASLKETRLHVILFHEYIGHRSKALWSFLSNISEELITCKPLPLPVAYLHLRHRPLLSHKIFCHTFSLTSFHFIGNITLIS